MSEQEEPLTTESPESSVEDDLLAPQERPNDDVGHDDDNADDDKRSRTRSRSLVPIGWSLVAVLAVLGALVFAEMLRISSTLNNSLCVQRAVATNGDYVGPGVTRSEAALARVSLRVSRGQVRPLTREDKPRGGPIVLPIGECVVLV